MSNNLMRPKVEFWGEIVHLLLNPGRCGFFVRSNHEFRGMFNNFYFILQSSNTNIIEVYALPLHWPSRLNELACVKKDLRVAHINLMDLPNKHNLVAF